MILLGLSAALCLPILARGGANAPCANCRVLTAERLILEAEDGMPRVVINVLPQNEGAGIAILDGNGPRILLGTSDIGSSLTLISPDGTQKLKFAVTNDGVTKSINDAVIVPE